MRKGGRWFRTDPPISCWRWPDAILLVGRWSLARRCRSAEEKGVFSSSTVTSLVVIVMEIGVPTTRTVLCCLLYELGTYALDIINKKNNLNSKYT